ncbi:hypothetical protein HBO38_36160 [Pseudomonas veronii]|uniref:Uncharacterized protein n=1 Tax=Pseudomonas veronii TaxID=76761 RepID=A0A7Y1FDB5_PSEVE|nr:hypothetical protein [Pseudomonas veronii]NMY13744.1 hypothetical protein [Pseudomonas veronii]
MSSDSDLMEVVSAIEPGSTSVWLECPHCSADAQHQASAYKGPSDSGVFVIAPTVTYGVTCDACGKAFYFRPKALTNTSLLSDVGPSWCKFLPDVNRWAAELAALARADMQGEIEALVWPYRLGGDEYLSVDMKGVEGGDLSITFGVGGVESTEYDFDNLAGNTCFNVPDMTEALSMTVVLMEKLSATVVLHNRQR